MRNLILVLHRWIALITGLFLVLISLSGAAIVFEAPLEHATAPELWLAPMPAPGAAMLSLDTLAARAAIAAGGPVSGVVMPSGPGLAAIASGPDGSQVFVNPWTGAVNGVRSAEARNAGLVRTIRRLHEQLLTGSTGNDVVGIVTVAAFIVVLGGIILWWKDRIWRFRLRGNWKRVNFDFHHASGIFTAVILLLMTGTGIWMQYDAVQDFVNGLDRAPPPAPAAQPAAAPGARALPLDSAARLGEAAVPGAALRMVSAPDDPKAPYMVALAYPEDHTPGGRSRVTIDRYRGTLLGVRSTRHASTVSHLTYLQRSIHTGDLFGLPTRLLWFAACLAMAGQAVSGALMWWHGRPARKAAARRARQARQTPA